MVPSALSHQPPVPKPKAHLPTQQRPPSPPWPPLPSRRGPRWAPRAPACTILLSLLCSRSKEDMLPAALSPEAQPASPSGGGKGGGGRSAERPVSAEPPASLVPDFPTPIPGHQEAANERPKIWVDLLPPPPAFRAHPWFPCVPY